MEKQRRYTQNTKKLVLSKKLFRIPAGTEVGDLDFLVTKRGKTQFSKTGSVDASNVRYEIYRGLIRRVRWK